MSYYITQPNVNATKSRNSLEIIDFTVSSPLLSAFDTDQVIRYCVNCDAKSSPQS